MIIFTKTDEMREYKNDGYLMLEIYLSLYQYTIKIEKVLKNLPIKVVWTLLFFSPTYNIKPNVIACVYYSK